MSIWRAGDTIEVPFYVQDGENPIEGLTESMFDVTLFLGTENAPEDVTIEESEDGGGVYVATFTQSATFSGPSCLYLIVIRTNNTATTQAVNVVEREIQVWQIDAAVEPWDGVRLCTVAEVHKAMKLPLDATDKDDVILMLIEAISEWIAQDQRLDFGDHTYDPTPDNYDGNGQNFLILRRHPVINIDSIRVNGDLLTDQAGYGDADCGWLLDGDTLRLRGSVFPRGVQNVRVITRWGFTSIPRMYKYACIKLVRYKLDDLTEHPNQTYRMVGNDQFRYLPDSMPADVREMLDGARRALAL